MGKLIVYFKSANRSKIRFSLKPQKKLKPFFLVAEIGSGYDLGKMDADELEKELNARTDDLRKKEEEKYACGLELVHFQII
ncbi:MAG: hypothetical protein WC458_03995 [Patescibacteria group bacterium]